MISIIVPVYNEEKTVEAILKKLAEIDLGIKKEIIVVDDGSSDNSRKVISSFIRKNKDKKANFILISKENGGKGSAIREGIKIAEGDIITIQDADLEYNPEEFKILIKPILEGKEKVVYGSRFLKKHKPLYRIYFMGNKFLSFLTQILYYHKVSDMETCYKVFRKDVIKNLDLRARKFDFEPEVTAKILKKGIKINEISISYSPRSVEEGKKINWKDGLQAIWVLIYFRFFD